MKYTVDAVIIYQDQVVLIKRKFPPFENFLALPGGFLEPNEQPIDACLRELKEETGLELQRNSLHPLSIRNKEGRDPRGPCTSYPFVAILHEMPSLSAGDDAAEVDLYPLDSSATIAFDHGEILLEALGTLFPFMPSGKFYDGARHLPRSLWKERLHEHLVFFGGSFNPWHEGHHACVHLFEQQFGMEHTLVVVPDFSPWKVDGKKISGFDYFWFIARKLEDSDAFVYPTFWSQEKPNPTVTWLPYVNAIRKSILVGADTLCNLERWQDVEFLLKHIDTIFIVPRDRSDKEVVEAQDRIRALNNNINFKMLPDHPYRNLSSTKLRGLI